MMSAFKAYERRNWALAASRFCVLRVFGGQAETGIQNIVEYKPTDPTLVCLTPHPRTAFHIVLELLLILY
jgi:hypothetical protein